MSERVWRILIESFPKILLPGLRMTLPLTVIASSIAMVIAVIVAMVQYAHVRVLSQVFRAYIWIIRGTPLLVQLFVVFYGLRAGYYMSPFWAAVLVFSINEGAYCAETMRGALEAVPVGQIEAGYCVGMSYTQIMRRIVLPEKLEYSEKDDKFRLICLWGKNRIFINFVKKLIKIRFSKILNIFLNEIKLSQILNRSSIFRIILKHTIKKINRFF